MDQSLIQTVAILAACVVFLSKQAVDAYKKAKNNGKGESPPKRFSCEECAAKVTDLHRWHMPQNDPATGQPRFLWYFNDAELRHELAQTRAVIAEFHVELQALSGNVRDLNKTLTKKDSDTP